jgi:uncharacterized protein YigE (DUF2233 family)
MIGEKWKPVFAKSHASTKRKSAVAVQPEGIALYPACPSMTRLFALLG